MTFTFHIPESIEDRRSETFPNNKLRNKTENPLYQSFVSLYWAVWRVAVEVNINNTFVQTIRLYYSLELGQKWLAINYVFRFPINLFYIRSCCWFLDATIALYVCLYVIPTWYKQWLLLKSDTQRLIQLKWCGGFLVLFCIRQCTKIQVRKESRKRERERERAIEN